MKKYLVTLLIALLFGCKSSAQLTSSMAFVEGCWVDSNGADGQVEFSFNFLADSGGLGALRGVIRESFDGVLEPYLLLAVDQGQSLIITKADAGSPVRLMRTEPPEVIGVVSNKHDQLVAFKVEEDEGEWVVFKGDNQRLIIFLVHADRTAGMTYFSGKRTECP